MRSAADDHGEDRHPDAERPAVGLARGGAPRRVTRCTVDPDTGGSAEEVGELVHDDDHRHAGEEAR